VSARAALTRLGGLHVLADDAPGWKRDPVEQTAAACAGGASVVQLRAKYATDGETLRWAEAIRQLCRRTDTLFVVNDRVDLALAAGADGVHLGQGDLPPSRLPERVRRRLLVGRSTHDVEQLRAAAAEPVDYVAFGPIFGTRSKRSPHAPRGLVRLREAALLASPRPLIAIGGVDSGNAADLIRAGAAGVAVISAVAAADEPEAATRALVDALEEAAEPP
jgi:thiamine-phosphate pyrophosphorylase